MDNVPRGGSFDTYYALAELARAYLQKHHPIDREALEKLRAHHAPKSDESAS